MGKAGLGRFADLHLLDTRQESGFHQVPVYVLGLPASPMNPAEYWGKAQA